MDRQPSAPGASAISDGSENLGVFAFSSIASSYSQRQVRTADAGIAILAGSMAHATISVGQILGRAPMSAARRSGMVSRTGRGFTPGDAYTPGLPGVAAG